MTWTRPPWLDVAAGWGWRLLVAGAALYYTALFLARLRFVAIPVLVALLATALLAPLDSRLRTRLPALASTWISLIVGLVFVLGLAGAATVIIGSELSDTDQWTSTETEVRTWLKGDPFRLDDEQIDDAEDRLDRWISTGVMQVDTDRARLAGDVVAGSLLGLVLTFFFLKDGRQIWGWALVRLASSRRRAVDRAGRVAFAALGAYVRGVAITGIVDGVLIGALLWALGVPLALPLGVLTFFAAFFPLVGATVVGALGTVVALVTVGPATALLVAAGTLVIQQVEGDVLMPLVMRKAIQLHPSVILIALAVGSTLGGIAGAFVAVPLAAMVSSAVGELRRSRPAESPESAIPAEGNDEGENRNVQLRARPSVGPDAPLP